MGSVHLVVGVAVIALNLVAGVWGGIAWWAERPSVGFWYVLRAAQVAVVVQVLLGGLLLLLGHEAADSLHYVYGSLRWSSRFSPRERGPESPTTSSPTSTSRRCRATASAGSRSRSSAARPGSWPSRRS